MVAGEADAVPQLVSPDNIERVQGTPHLATYPYKGSAYGYVGFNLNAPGDSTKAHPLFADREVRRGPALALHPPRPAESGVGGPAKRPARPVAPAGWGGGPGGRGAAHRSRHGKPRPPP